MNVQVPENKPTRQPDSARPLTLRVGLHPFKRHISRGPTGGAEAAPLEASPLSAESTNDHSHRKFIQPAVFPQHKLFSVRMRLIGFESTFQSGETLSLSFPSRVCSDPADPHLPSKCLSLFLKFVRLLKQTTFLQGRRSNQTIPRGRKGKEHRRGGTGERLEDIKSS